MIYVLSQKFTLISKAVIIILILIILLFVIRQIVSIVLKLIVQIQKNVLIIVK